jgi:hypothetical protein
VTGRLVLWLGTRLLHADTQVLVVEPAVADLQQAPAWTVRERLTGHLGAWVALGGALLLDAVTDPRRPVWIDGLGTFAGLALIMAGYQLAMFTLLLGLVTSSHQDLMGWWLGFVPGRVILAGACVVAAVLGVTHTREGSTPTRCSSGRQEA